MLQYSCLEKPPDREAWQATVYWVTKCWTQPKRPCTIDVRPYFACSSSAPVRVEHEDGAAAWLAGLWQSQVCRDTDCLHHRSYGPIRVCFRASCSWRPEGLLGQSFSVAPHIQALRGFPYLVSFSVVWHVGHIEGPPWLGSYSVVWHISHLKEHPGWGSYSVVQCVRHLMGQPLYCSAADAGMWGERGYDDGSTPYM